MPRVPTAGAPQRIQYTPQSSPGQTLAAFSSAAKVFDQGAQIALVKKRKDSQLALELQDRQDIARRKQEAAEVTAAITVELGQAQIDAANDPRINGSTDRFAELSNDVIAGHLENVSDQLVADSVKLSSTKLFASMRVSVAQTERRRFNAVSVTTLEQLTDNYILAASQATNDEVRDAIDEQHLSAIAQSDFLTLAKRDELNDRYEAGVSNARALRLLISDPDLLADTISDPTLFPGISPEQAVRLLDRALSEARIKDEREIQQAKDDMKDIHDKNLSNMLLLLDGDVLTSSIRLHIQQNTSSFSPAGLRVLLTALHSKEITSDDPETVVELDKAIDAGETGAGDDIDAAYINGRIEIGTRTALHARNALSNEPKSSPVRRAYADIRDALGPAEDDSRYQRATAVLRRRSGLRELDIWIKNNPGHTDTQLSSQITRIIEAFPGAGGVEEVGSLRAPFGISNKSIDMITEQDVIDSNALLDLQLANQLMSDDTYVFLIESNEKLMPVAKKNDLGRAQ
jgi:hypothetical protein